MKSRSMAVPAKTISYYSFKVISWKIPVIRSQFSETTALGAARLAGLSAGTVYHG